MVLQLAVHRLAVLSGRRRRLVKRTKDRNLRAKDHRKDSGRPKVFRCHNGPREERDKKALGRQKDSGCFQKDRILKAPNRRKDLDRSIGNNMNNNFNSNISKNSSDNHNSNIREISNRQQDSSRRQYKCLHKT